MADCTGLDVDAESGNVAWTRPAFGGNLMATILCPDHRPQIGTVRPGVFKKGEAGEAKAEIIKEDIHVDAADIRTQILELIKEEGGETVDLEGAEIIVSGGRGVGGPEGFEPVKALADVLGGVVGASRAAVDAGWIAHAHQVGQTGKTVGPKLYIACGISGAIQHLKGIRDASTIVAVNKNAGAPIFKNCDYGIVGDVNEILPLLTAALDCGEKQPAPPMVKMKRPQPPKPEPIGKRYVCGGCGYEYIPELGDEDAEIAPGTLFEKLPEDWVCPECAEGKHQFIRA